MPTLARRYTSVSQLQKMDGYQHPGMSVLPSARFTEFTRNNNLLTDARGAGASLGKSAATISYYDSTLEPAGLNRVAIDQGMRSSANRSLGQDAYGSVKGTPSGLNYQVFPRKRSNLQAGTLDMLPM